MIAVTRDCLPYIRIREEDVKKLEKLVMNKGYGPDVNPPIVRKHRREAIRTHIHQLIYFRRSLALGVLLTELITGCVIPIQTSGSTSLVSNYRPVVIQPTLCIILDSFVLDCVGGLFFWSLIISEKNGFRPGKSTLQTS